MTDIDFSKDSAHFNSNIEYMPDALLTPEEFAASEDIVLGAVPNGTSCLTSRIYVNGEWLADTGLPGTTKETTAHREKLMFFSVRPADGVDEIIQ